MGQAATVDWPQPAAVMNPINSLGGNINPQQNPYLPLTQEPGYSQAHAQQLTSSAHRVHQPIRGSSLRHQITDQLVAPSDILEYDRPTKRTQANPDLSSQGMDKRHPSSFQQLEKVRLCPSRPRRPATNTCYSWAREHMQQYDAIEKIPLLCNTADLRP